MKQNRLSLPVLFLTLLSVTGIFNPVQPAHASPPEFVSVISDLPLMPGLTEDPVASVVFETKSGRIAQAVAHGAVDRQAVLDFYADALPQLGWQEASRQQYRREGEVLNIELVVDPAVPGRLTVEFNLVPAPS